MKLLWLFLGALLLSACAQMSNPEYEALRQTAQARFDATSDQSAQQSPAPTSVWSAAQPVQTPVPTAEPAAAPAQGPMMLQETTRFWYAPNPTSDQEYGAVPAGTVIEPLARYGDEWVHLRVKDYGELWTRTEHVSSIDTAQLIDYATEGE